jgi:hypothetical protein
MQAFAQHIEFLRAIVDAAASRHDDQEGRASSAFPKFESYQAA